MTLKLDHSYLKSSPSFVSFSDFHEEGLSECSSEKGVEEVSNRKRKISSLGETHDEIDEDCDFRSIIDENNIIARWNIATMADPGVNLTMINYRKKVFGDDRPPAIRQFKPGVFYPNNDDSKNEQTEDLEALAQQDKATLRKRIKLINSKYHKEKLSIDNEYYFNWNRLTQNYQQYWMLYSDQFDYFDLKSNYDKDHLQLRTDYETLLRQNSDSRALEIRALNELYYSNIYKKGRLHEYGTLEVYQPASKRRKYEDDGHRLLILPQTLISNLQIEDNLYNHYYGKPDGIMK